MFICQNVILIILILLSYFVFSSNSTEKEAKGQTDRLQLSELESIVNKPALLELTAKHRPANCMTYWLEESEMDKIELENDDVIRLKTLGDGPFLCKCCVGYFGGYMIQSWVLLCHIRADCISHWLEDICRGMDLIELENGDIVRQGKDAVLRLWNWPTVQDQYAPAPYAPWAYSKHARGAVCIQIMLLEHIWLGIVF